MDSQTITKSFEQLHDEMVACRACPRLVEWREHIAHEKKRAFQHETYWGKPVPGFGDVHASIVLVGLAPAAHGGNRTGRLFTGDGSGHFLFSALHRTGFANQSTSVSSHDGLTLKNMFILAPVRCAPPQNKPLPNEFQQCSHWFERELALLHKAQIFIALGAMAWKSILEYGTHCGHTLKPKPKFGHGASIAMGPYTLIGSYHVSQQNTQTGTLTESMFDHILTLARTLAKRGSNTIET